MEVKKYTLEEIQTKLKKVKKYQKLEIERIKKIMFDNMDKKIISLDNINFNIVCMLILGAKLKMDLSISIFEEWKKEYEETKRK